MKYMGWRFAFGNQNKAFELHLKVVTLTIF